MSNHRIFRCAISVILVLSLLLSFCPMPAYAQEEVISVSFLIEKEAYSVEMKFEGDQLYCRADQWAEAAGCLWVFNSEQQKVLFYYEGPTILVFYNNETYIKDGENLWVPFFDVATQTGVCFSEVSGNTIRGYRVTPLAVIYKDMDRMFNISQYRISEMLLELDEKWVLLDSAARAYAILSSFSIKGFLDAVSGKMDQDMYDTVLLDMLRTDETLLGAITGAGEEIERSGKIINLLQKSLDEDGALVELLEQMDFSESDIREIVWDLSQEAYGNKPLNDLSDLYEANNTTHFLEMLKFVDDMTVSLEADIHSVMAMQEVFLNSDNVYMRQAAQKAIGARVGNKTLTAGMYSLEFLGDVFLDQTVEKLDDLCKEAAGTTSLSELGGRAFVWALDKALSLTETTDAIMYSDAYSLVQLELVNYYYRHRNAPSSDNGLMMHSVALLYLRACLASWQMYAFDDALSQSIDNATSMLTAEITNLMRYTEEELLQNGTKEETVQAILAFVKILPDLLNQEGRYLEFLQTHPEYSYYAVLDTNGDGLLELLATDRVGVDNVAFSADWYVLQDGAVVSVHTVRHSMEPFSLDNKNHWITYGINGVGVYGTAYASLNEALTVQVETLEYAVHHDEEGNEVVSLYYNGIDIAEDPVRYNQFAEKINNSSSQAITFKLIPKTAPNEESGYCHSYPLGDSVCYDLNGDGVFEEITVSSPDDEYGFDEITIDIASTNCGLNITASKNELMTSLENATGYFTILNVDTSKKRLFLGISEYGPSDDAGTYLYSYDNMEIKEIGYFDDILGKNSWEYDSAICNGDGTISITTRSDILGTWGAKATISVDNSTITDITDFYTFADFYEYSIGRSFTTKCDVIMYNNKEDLDSQVIIPAGTIVYMTGHQHPEEEQTWVAFKRNEFEDAMWLCLHTMDWPNSIETSEGLIDEFSALDGIYYAG